MPATAFVLAAGFGTRLRPLTEHLPKPLVPLCGLPLLDQVEALLARHGFREAVVNAHLHAERIAAWARSPARRLAFEVSLEAAAPLGTGGGLRRAAHLLADRFVVVNGDLLTDVDPTGLAAALEALPPGPAAAMALRERRPGEPHPVVAADASGRVVDLAGIARAEPHGAVSGDTHFTGVHALRREALELVPEGVACIVRTAYAALVPLRRVAAVPHHGLWRDLGRPRDLLEANLGVLRGDLRPPLDPLPRAAWAVRPGRGGRPAREVGSRRAVDLAPGAVVEPPFWFGPGVRIGARARIGPGVVLGAHALVEAGARLREAVVWDGQRVSADRGLERCIVHHGGVLVVGGGTEAR